MTYYNEIEPYCADWLENLIQAGEIPDGWVDRRPIQEVKASDLEGFEQCHFFAGIGGWALALRIAGWPDECPVWTGSCPCQPFSVSGQQKGFADERHLWPYWRSLLAEFSPANIFGEQVASEAGRDWFSHVRSDLETLEYAVGCADLCSASVGTDFPRQRLYFVAKSMRTRLAGFDNERSGIRVTKGASSTKFCYSSVPTRVHFLPDPATVESIHGIPRPVGLVRAFGNSIVPQLAAEFILSSVQAMHQLEGSIPPK